MGRTLAQHLKEVVRFSEIEALRFFIPLSFALGYAHLQGVIHRDLKPSNIVLEQDLSNLERTVPKIVDFGIAKLAEDVETETLTRTGEVFGTPLI